MNKTVFISYSWKEPSAGIVSNWLKMSLENATIKISVDKEDCKYHDSIKEFEQKIGDADMIISVISRPYLNSIHCMYEIASIFEKGGEMEKRLFFIGIENIQTEAELRDYWSKELFDTETELAATSIAREPIEKRLEQVKLICNYLGRFMVYLSDRNRMDFTKVSEGNFREVVNRLQNRISEAEIPKDNLILANNMSHNN